MAARRAAIDTGALIALASSRDRYHQRAVGTATRFRRGGGRWIASTLVLSEFHGHLLRWVDAGVARRLLAGLLADPAYEWHDATVDLLASATTGWLERFHDERFSLTDAVTFELMKRERVRDAFAFDQHFVTAGFQLLD